MLAGGAVVVPLQVADDITPWVMRQVCVDGGESWRSVSLGVFLSLQRSAWAFLLLCVDECRWVRCTMLVSLGSRIQEIQN